MCPSSSENSKMEKTLYALQHLPINITIASYVFNHESVRKNFCEQLRQSISQKTE
jgi:hypothetical protein